MKAKLKALIVIPLFISLFLVSCQDEIAEVTSGSEETETLTSASTLTGLIRATSLRDGSADNILDRASCISVELPVTVVLPDIQITVNSRLDFKLVENVLKEFYNDENILELVFPIKVITSNYEEIVVENANALAGLVGGCKGENEEDEDIECIDFQYPISFSSYNSDFQIIDVVSVNHDRDLFHFMQRVKQEEGLLVSLNFPVTTQLLDGTKIVVNSHEELRKTIEDVKDTCDEDDDNNFGDDDFTKERLDEYLNSCPWVINKFEKNSDQVQQYNEYAMVFKENAVVDVYTTDGAILTGSWETTVTNNGALINLEFETLIDFNLEWFVYDLEDGRITLYKEGGNSAILKNDCDVDLNQDVVIIKNYLQECLWRVERLKIDDISKTREYIATPLEFFENNTVKLRLNGDFIEGNYEIGKNDLGLFIQIFIDGRPDLQLEWLAGSTGPELIQFVNNSSFDNPSTEMLLARHCPGIDENLNFINDELIDEKGWEITTYEIDGQNLALELFSDYTLEFSESGVIKVVQAASGDLLVNGSWLSYKSNNLQLALSFGDDEPFSALTHRWEINSVVFNIIKLIDVGSSDDIKRTLILEKKN